MTLSSRNRFFVFEFNEDDEMAEKIDAELQLIYQNPKFDPSRNLEYYFRASVAQGSDVTPRKGVAVQYVDLDDIDEGGHCSSNVALQTLSTLMENSRPLFGCLDAINSDLQPNWQMGENICSDISANSDMNDGFSCPGGNGLENSHAGSPFTESLVDSGSLNSTKSSHVLSNKNGSLSSPDACEDSCPELSFKGLDMEEVKCVVVHPDYVLFNENYYPAPQITFSDNSIKLEISFLNKDVENCMYEWEIDEHVFNIKSRVCTKVGETTPLLLVQPWLYAYSYTKMDLDNDSTIKASVVELQICILPRSTVKIANMRNALGFEELKIVVFDLEWSLILEKLKSLNVKYQAAWEDPARVKMDGFHANKQKPYFPLFDEHFEEILYPEGCVDAVSISKRDVDRLNPETFINDTIVDFYFQYLKNGIPSGERNRFHFFNSFFLRKFYDLDKNHLRSFDSKAAFPNVRKWTRKLNIFEKDYIFIPVNYNLHWSLIVICHPGGVADIIDKKPSGPSRVPCILHMDSIRGSHTGLKKLIQGYLLEEWKERQNGASEDISSKFLNLLFLSLPVPQQENLYDCGLFMLHYAELFLKEAPLAFSPLNITQYSTFLTADWIIPDEDWFIPAEVCIKRPYIKSLIHEILLTRSQKNNNDVSDEEIALEEDKTRGAMYVERLKGIDMSRQGGSSSSVCYRQSSLALRGRFEPGSSSRALY